MNPNEVFGRASASKYSKYLDFLQLVQWKWEQSGLEVNQIGYSCSAALVNILVLECSLFS